MEKTPRNAYLSIMLYNRTWLKKKWIIIFERLVIPSISKTCIWDLFVGLSIYSLQCLRTWYIWFEPHENLKNLCTTLKILILFWYFHWTIKKLWLILVTFFTVFSYFDIRWCLYGIFTFNITVGDFNIPIFNFWHVITG